MEDKKTLILIDGHALAFRSYFALERTGMKTSDKEPTWAVFGFFKAIFDLLKNPKINPDCICVAFDVGHQTFRVEKYEEYKANRESMPDNMRSQMGLIMDGLKAFNIPIYTKEGFEADDVIGTIAKKASALGHRTIILTGDQDAFQLIDREGTISVLIPSKGELIDYDWARVYNKLGVYPDQVIDYKALRGDTSDNIPGIRGIGEKTAVKLLDRFQTLDNVLAHVDDVDGKSLKEKLKNGVDMAKLSYFLATIKCDVDIDFDFEKTKLDMPDVDGIEFSKKNLDSKIVFITNYDTRIKEAFGPNVYGYISKSNLENELYNKVDEMITLIKDNYTVSFNVHGQETLVRINDIIYCQFLGGRIVSIVYKNKSLMIKNVTLKKVREKLDNRFIKINRDTIINQNKIIDFQNDNVYLEGVNSRFEVSVRNRTLIKRVFFEKYR